jgi:Cdc6-like AAA superfamily ATPase
MNKKNLKQDLVEELKHIITTTDRRYLLEELKELAINLDLDKREQFEYALLEQAKGIDNFELRQIIYEIMASLNSIWESNRPRQGLIASFWNLYNNGKYDEARQVCSDLIQQGLDYTGTFELQAGKLLPVFTKDRDFILQYTEQRMVFLDQDLKTIKPIPIPSGKKIIDVLSPPLESKNFDKKTDLAQKLWLLMEEPGGDRNIIPFNLSNDRFEGDGIPVTNLCKDAQRISIFKEYLLLLSSKTIFYFEPEAGWKKWLTLGEEITCSQSLKDGFWIGLANGEVFILKTPGLEGVRKRIKDLNESIVDICTGERFLIISSEKDLNLIAEGSISISNQIKTKSRVLQSIILNDEITASIQANGFLVGREIHQEYIPWQLNLEEVYDSIFKINENIYLSNSSGNTALLKIPGIHAMTTSLEKHRIRLAEKPIDREPDAPIRHITEFTGRKDLLSEIKDGKDDHFLIYGEPRIGKTSLLNVLANVLSSNSHCCYFDFSQLIDTVNTYKEFETLFLERSLAQHTLKLKKEEYNQGHQTFRTTIDKIRREKRFCVFCLDNFCSPGEKDKEFQEKFKTFLTEMYIHPNVRMMLTCSTKKKNEVWEFLKQIREGSSVKQREIKELYIPHLSVEEVKTILRSKLQLNQDKVDLIYLYTGCFPHLLHLFDRWEKGKNSIQAYSGQVVKIYCDKIFSYFRDLDPEARLFLAICFYEKLIGKKIQFKQLYDSYSIFIKLFPKESLKKALDEIAGYGETFRITYHEEHFFIGINNNALLFTEASKHLLWINVFTTLHKFTLVPIRKNAEGTAAAFSELVNIGLQSDHLIEELSQQYRKNFYIHRLTQEGRQALGMPLDTFLVIPLKPWEQGKSNRDFSSLYISILERMRKARISADDDTLSFKSYILLLVFHGIDSREIKEEIKGLERVSIIDTRMIKDIIVDEDPQGKSSEYIFNQLNISERSPYTTSGAVQDLFYGRELEIALIRGLPENIGIFGTRTIGKTSLLLKLNRDIKAQKNWKVYILDCSRIDSEEALLQNLAEKMDISPGKIDNMEKFRKYISKQADEKRIQFLFLLDEVDRLVQYDLEHEEKIFRTFNKMCAESLESGGFAARFILVGFHQMFEQMKNPESRLYNFMVFLPLRPLDKKSALALVTKPMKDIRVKWDKAEQDANYLVDNCSGHPLLLQAACHSLLSILDEKEENKDMIERTDIDKVFNSNQFQQLCMRFYHSNPSKKKNKTETKKGLWERLFRVVKSKEEPREQNEEKRESIMKDIHRITILCAVLLFNRKGKEKQDSEHFSLTDIHEVLKTYGIDIAPDHMRKILDHLCLLGVLRLIDEPTLIASRDTHAHVKVNMELQQMKKEKSIEGTDLKEVKLDLPDIYAGQGEKQLKFTYEFAVKIFPRLLVANFDGIDNCKEELVRLVEKQEWLN